MLKQKWFNAENLKKFNMTKTCSYSIPRYVSLVRNLSKEEGHDLGLNNAVKLLSKVKASWRAEIDESILLLLDRTLDGNSLFKINPNFNWDYYTENFANSNSETLDELSLLQSIANMINKEFSSKRGFYKSELPSNIAYAMKIWTDKYSKNEVTK